MNPMGVAMVGAVVRWLLTLASQHVNISDEQTNNIVAGLIAVVPLIWSLFQKKRVNKQIKDAKAGL